MTKKEYEKKLEELKNNTTQNNPDILNWYKSYLSESRYALKKTIQIQLIETVLNAGYYIPEIEIKSVRYGSDMIYFYESERHFKRIFTGPIGSFLLRKLNTGIEIGVKNLRIAQHLDKYNKDGITIDIGSVY